MHLLPPNDKSMFFEYPDFKDVFIIPQYSEVTSRSRVETKQAFAKTMVDVPVISANMDTVTDGKMAAAMSRAGAIGAIHRFMSIEQNIEEFKRATIEGGNCLVSIGVNDESKERAAALISAGAKNIVVDIAHGHSFQMKKMVTWLRQEYGNRIYIVAGNVATAEGIQDLLQWGADAVKLGIGPGAVCSTKNVTGVTIPQFGMLKEVCQYDYAKYVTAGNGYCLIADGGILEIGDIAKAIGAGADMVMCGRLFATCQETPGPRINGGKVYRGMASKDAMLTIRENSNLPTPEGISTVLTEPSETAASVVSAIKGGLQSSFSYSNSLDIEDFQEKVKFGMRKNRM